MTASPGPQRLNKSRSPELADISVTDACDIGCAFCYRGSVPEGKHATLENLRWIASELAAAGTFEVALGGGEISQHPSFVEVLSTFHQAGLVTNFTTRAPAQAAARWAEIDQLVGALAVSVGSPGEIERLQQILEEIPRNRVNLHLVMGTMREESYLKSLEAAARHGHRVTLLGYKRTHRGASYAPLEHAWWIGGLEVARRLGLALSIDTTLAAEWEQQILDAGIQPELFHTQEGKHSIFIDAVQMGLASSSYATEPLIPMQSGWLERDWPLL